MIITNQKVMVSQERLIEYLQSMLDDYNDEVLLWGKDDRIANKKLNVVIACKEMVECLIHQPVNLQKDGKVTVGF